MVNQSSDELILIWSNDDNQLTRKYPLKNFSYRITNNDVITYHCYEWINEL